jgi:hypothetical protein
LDFETLIGQTSLNWTNRRSALPAVTLSMPAAVANWRSDVSTVPFRV